MVNADQVLAAVSAQLSAALVRAVTVESAVLKAALDGRLSRIVVGEHGISREPLTRDVVNNPTDRDILLILSEDRWHLKGSVVARRLGRSYSSYFRSRLSALRKAGHIGLDADGYFLS